MIRLALFCVAILIAFPSFSLGQSPRRQASAVRPASTGSSVARGASVPRPTKPVGRLASSRQEPTSLLQGGETVIANPQGSRPPVTHSSPIIEDRGIIVEDEGVIYEEEGHCTSCGETGCTSCGDDFHGAIGPYGIDICNPTGLGGRRLCICLPSHGWVSVDYLGWYQAGMNTPALVTTSPGPPQSAAGVLPGAQVLYGGNDDILTDAMNGVRVRVGVWSATRPNAGVEGEYFGFGQQHETFDRVSSGTPILARPFYDLKTGSQISELVAFPGVISGRVTVESDSELASAAVRFRHMLCCSNACGYSPLACAPIQAQSRLDWTIGWRYAQLREGLLITETLSTTNPTGTFLLEDSFKTFNQFNGAELGVQWLGRRGYWSLEALMRMSLGNSLQRLEINGSTLINNAVPAGPQGGLLAQPSRNIGSYEQEEFAVIPELGATLGYQLTERLKLNVGYTFLYWSNLIRPGDQIDTTVNPDLLSPAIPTNTFLGPGFEIRETDYWVQGLSVGCEYRW